MDNKKIAVIGLSTFGIELARTLAKRGLEVFAIDIDNDKVNKIDSDVAYAVVLDATNNKALISQEIDKYDIIVIAIGENFEQRILCAAALLEIGAKNIYCRSLSDSQTKILNKLGIENILTPEYDIARITAEKIIYPNITSLIHGAGEDILAEISVPQDLLDRQVKDIEFTDKYRILLITVKRKADIDNVNMIESYIPKSDMIFKDGDKLVLFGKQQDLERFISINS